VEATGVQDSYSVKSKRGKALNLRLDTGTGTSLHDWAKQFKNRTFGDCGDMGIVNPR